MESKQTAVEWFFEHLMPFIEFSDAEKREDVRNVLEQAKAMAEKQHENTWIEGQSCKMPDTYIGKEKTFQQYYTETYGKS
jgi:hypothetical protein